jgi:membrane protein implicated in regulation of membrane protease activity
MYYFCFYEKVAANFLLDIAKLLIGGIFLTGIMGQNIPLGLLFTIGGFVIALFVTTAFLLLWLDKKTKKK